MINKRRWGQGLAREAAIAIVEYARSQLQLTRLICLIMPGNAASMGVARRAGMHFERELTDSLGLRHVYSMSL